MKKILVVLLVLAVAGGVFAQQGEWTQSASVKLSSAIDFEADPDATVGLAGWEGDSGSYELGYTKDGLKATIGFEVKPQAFFMRSPDNSDDDDDIVTGQYDNGSLNVGVEYTGDNYAFQAKAPLVRMLMGDSRNFSGILIDPLDVQTDPEAVEVSVSNYASRFGDNIDKLWGYYEMLNGIFHLEAGYKGRDSNFWESSDAGGGSFTSMNNANFILGNVHFGSLDFGLIVKNLFYTVSSKRPELINDALMQSAFGVKFVMAPVEFAVNFGFDDYPVYLGVKYSVSPLTVGLGFTGKLGIPQPPVKAGIKLEYEPGVFNATLLAQLMLNGEGNDYVTSDKDHMAIGIEPSFWYNVIPDTFRFAVNTGFYFFNKDVSWKVEPVITWNFLRTGADGFGGIGTGMGLKYTLVKNVPKPVNALTVGFHWALP